MDFHLPLSFFPHLTCHPVPGLIPGLRDFVLVTAWRMSNETNPSRWLGKDPVASQQARRP